MEDGLRSRTLNLPNMTEERSPLRLGKIWPASW